MVLLKPVTLFETAGLLASGGEGRGTRGACGRGNDPVDAGIATDGLVLWVDEDDLEVLVGRVLVDPVGVKDAQVGATAADTLLSSRLEGALVLELVNSLVGGLACDGTSQYIGLRVENLFGVTYRRWHPCERASCGHHGEHGRGR